MLGLQEIDEIRRQVHREMVDIEDRIEHYAGSYTYLCLIAGSPCFTHGPVGPVLRYLPPPGER